MFVVGFFILVAVQAGLVALVGWLLMLPGLASWRAALRDRQWRWLKRVFYVTPALLVLAGPWVAAVFLRQMPQTIGIMSWLNLPFLVGFFGLPALAACWHSLPPNDAKGFPFARAMAWAWGISILNYVPTLLVKALFV